MRILAVDDDQTALDILSSSLQSAGYTNYVTALSGAQALDEIARAEQPFDIFLLDIQMPEIDGIELCTKVRAMPAHRTTPIIMITAMAERHFIDGAFAAGAMDYVNKPFDPIELGVRLSVAARVVAQNKKIQAAMSEVEYLQLRSGAVASLDPSEPIEINEIPRVVGMTSMENYLLRLTKGMTLQSKSVAFSIDGFDVLHANMSSTELYDILADTAEAIATGLKRTEHLITYCGNGNFVAVCHKSANLHDDTLLFDIQSALDSFEPCFDNGRPCPLTLKQSKCYAPGLLASLDGLNLLIKPLKLLREDTNSQPSAKLTSFFRPFEPAM